MRTMIHCTQCQEAGRSNRIETRSCLYTRLTHSWCVKYGNKQLYECATQPTPKPIKCTLQAHACANKPQTMRTQAWHNESLRFVYPCACCAMCARVEWTWMKQMYCTFSALIVVSERMVHPRNARMRRHTASPSVSLQKLVIASVRIVNAPSVDVYNDSFSFTCLLTIIRLFQLFFIPFLIFILNLIKLHVNN